MRKLVPILQIIILAFVYAAYCKSHLFYDKIKYKIIADTNRSSLSRYYVNLI